MEKLLNSLKVQKIVVISVLISILLSLFVLYTPKIVASNESGSFSSVRASNHLAEITKKPHSYTDQVELEEVRVYIENTLANYLGNSNVERFIYTPNQIDAIKDSNDNYNTPYDMVNIMGTLKGESDLGVLLVAHYDSRGHIGRYGELGRSYGAMDDGYGVSSLLELAFILKDLNPKNSVYFLFTDAEEVGLYGAKLAANDANVMDNVRFVINIESRGSHGPAYMFETSTNNHKVIDLYKHAKYPVSYSMATAVYSVMPNFTDFTPFIEKGVPGINFANLAGLDSYHSPLDTYELISMTTIQHMGSQVEPVVREFISDSKYVSNNYFEAKNDAVFFTLFANVFVTYSQTFAYILMALLLIAFGILLYFLIKSEKINKETITKTLPKALLLTTILLVASYLFSNIVAFLGKVPFNLFYVRVKGIDKYSLLFIILMALILTKKVKESNKDSVLVISVSVNILLTLLTTLLLPGASFLFAFTSLFGMIVLSSNYVSKKLYKHIMLVGSYLILFLLLVPLLYSFYMALTVGGMLVLVLLLIIVGSVISVSITKQLEIGEEV